MKCVVTCFIEDWLCYHSIYYKRVFLSQAGTLAGTIVEINTLQVSLSIILFADQELLLSD